MINHKILDKQESQKLFQFSICTIANNIEEYAEMKKSFELCGFDDKCEYLLADNSKENLLYAKKLFYCSYQELLAQQSFFFNQCIGFIDWH